MVETLKASIGKNRTAEYSNPTWIDHDEVSPPCLEVLEPDCSISLSAKKIPDEFIILSELALEEKIRKENKGSFDRTLGLIKIMFWDEYRRSLVAETTMDTEAVWKPLVSERWWNANILNNPLHLAWVISPPADEAVVKREMMLLGMKRLREALDLPLREKVKVPTLDENGVKKNVIIWQTNVSLLREIHSIVRTLQDRVYGAVTQQHHVKSLNVKVDAKPSELPGLGMGVSMDELDQYAEKLKGISSTIEEIAKSDGEIIETDTSSS